MSAVLARAPGKVNLALSVGSPGLDGFHPIATVFHAVGLYDDVVARPTATSGEGISLTVTTVNTRLARILEPRAPRPDLRLQAVTRLAPSVRLMFFSAWCSP